MGTRTDLDVVAKRKVLSSQKYNFIDLIRHFPMGQEKMKTKSFKLRLTEDARLESLKYSRNSQTGLSAVLCSMSLI
jgi:hypothetical protein